MLPCTESQDEHPATAIDPRSLVQNMIDDNTFSRMSWVTIWMPLGAAACRRKSHHPARRKKHKARTISGLFPGIIYDSDKRLHSYRDWGRESFKDIKRSTAHSLHGDRLMELGCNVCDGGRRSDRTMTHRTTDLNINIWSISDTPGARSALTAACDRTSGRS